MPPEDSLRSFLKGCFCLFFIPKKFIWARWKYKWCHCLKTCKSVYFETVLELALRPWKEPDTIKTMNVLLLPKNLLLGMKSEPMQILLPSTPWLPHWAVWQDDNTWTLSKASVFWRLVSHIFLRIIILQILRSTKEWRKSVKSLKA